MRIYTLRSIEIPVHSKNSAPEISRVIKARFKELFQKAVLRSVRVAKIMNTNKKFVKYSLEVKQRAFLSSQKK